MIKIYLKQFLYVSDQSLLTKNNLLMLPMNFLNNTVVQATTVTGFILLQNF